MTTLVDFLEQIQSKLQDDAFDDDMLTALINKGIRRCAYVVTLPGLESTGVFTTDPTSSSVSIPSSWNFGKGLYDASVANKPKINVLSSMGLFKDQVPDIDTLVNVGDIRFITARKTELIYSPSPSVATTVVCKFYENPTDLVLDTDEPSCIPEALQEELIINYVLWKCYTGIEDGIEGPKVNTSFHKNEFLEALGELDFTFKTGRSDQDPHRESSWI